MPSLKTPPRKLFDGAFTDAYAEKVHSLSPDAIRELPVSALRHVPDGAKGTLDSLLDLRWEQVDRIAVGSVAIQHLLDWLACQRVDNAMPCSWVRRFQNAPLDHHVLHPSGRFRTEFGPVFHRGRLDGSARVLVVGQDPSTDEVLAHRTLVGQAGQRTQLLLNKLGMKRSYLMVNTFIFGIHGSVDAEMRNISLEPAIKDYRNGIFDKVVAENTIEAIISLGNGADHALANWPGRTGRTIFEITHPTAPSGVVTSWNSNLAAMHAAINPDDPAQVDLAPFTTALLDAGAPIPRHDLPFGVPAWHGTGGTRSQRNGDNIINWTSPL